MYKPLYGRTVSSNQYSVTEREDVINLAQGNFVQPGMLSVLEFAFIF